MDEKFEQAISAALGELTDLLIVPSGGKDLVVEYLESKHRDRVALVTMDGRLDKKHRAKAPGIEGVFGYANELVRVEPQYKALVDQLFSDTLIVRDRGTALKLQPGLTGTERAVTLNGLVFQANGVMISGQNGSGKRIGRTRRQSEMKDDLAKLGDDIAALKREESGLTISLKASQEKRLAVKNQLDRLEKQLGEARHAQQAAQDTLTRMEEQFSWLNEQMGAIDENITKTLEAISASSTKVDDLTAKISEQYAAEDAFQGTLSDLPLFELQQEVNHWQTHQIVTKNALDAAQQRYQDHQNRMSDVRQRWEIYQNRLKELEERLEVIKSQELSLKADLEEIKHAIQATETENIKPLSASESELENTVSALEKLESHSHEQLMVAERHFTQLQLELSRSEDQLNNLREKIEDDFGLVSFEYEPQIDGSKPLPLGDDLVQSLPQVSTVPDTIDDDIKQLKGRLRRVGAVNPEAKQEFLDVEERFNFLTTQISDLEKASEDLQEVIEKLDEMMARDFLKTFKAVDQEFSAYFARLFNGGEAKLRFSDPENPVEGGVEIMARLPGRRQQELSLLSGGERSLTSVALIFALLKVSPTPFCILDEVDAMLDESNVGRFIELLQELASKTQFVIITHNRNTVQAADVIYGVTMGRDSTSQMISLKLEEVDESYLE